jgi:hypothetical protein
MLYALRCFINNLKSMFSVWQSSERLRLMSVEQDIHIIKRVLSLDPLDVTADSTHHDAVVSKSVMSWLDNWASDKYVTQDDIDEVVSNAVDDYDFSDAVERCIDDKDWDYIMRDSLDWDKAAELVVEKLDWDTIISDNELLTESHIDVNDIMLKSDHMSEDDLVTRADLSDMVVGELKRDWFDSMLKEQVTRQFKDTLMSVRQTEEENARNAIDDEIVAKVDTLVGEELRKKFGDSFDIWFHNLIAHSVKQVISDMIVAAHQQVVDNASTEDDSNV